MTDIASASRTSMPVARFWTPIRGVFLIILGASVAYRACEGAIPPPSVILVSLQGSLPGALKPEIWFLVWSRDGELLVSRGIIPSDSTQSCIEAAQGSIVSFGGYLRSDETPVRQEWAVPKSGESTIELRLSPSRYIYRYSTRGEFVEFIRRGSGSAGGFVSITVRPLHERFGRACRIVLLPSMTSDRTGPLSVGPHEVLISQGGNVTRFVIHVRSGSRVEFYL